MCSAANTRRTTTCAVPQVQGETYRRCCCWSRHPLMNNIGTLSGRFCSVLHACYTILRVMSCAWG